MSSEDLSSGSKIVRKANKASASQISKSVRDIPDSAHAFKTTLAGSLDESTRNLIWSIFEANMRTLLTPSSLGWDPPNKLAELFNPLSRFILVYSNDALIAFSAFRFEFEEEENLLYCYDLQVSESSRRHGLGRALIQHLERIGADFKLEKIMLTVLKANAPALRFYGRIGFKMDESSPTDEDPEDYKILSKIIQ